MSLNIVEKSKAKYLLHEKRRKDILEAAIKTFNKRGYKSATMSEIVQDADILKPTLYKYFKNKKELFLACFHSIINDLREETKKIGDDYIDDEIGYLKKIAKIYLDHIVSRPDKSMFLVHILSYSNDKDFDRVYKKTVGEQVEFIEKIIDSAKKKGKIKSPIGSQMLAGFLVCQYFTIISVEKFVKPKELTTDKFFHLMKCMIESD